MPLSAELAHDAMFCGSDDEFVAALVPFARHGLERDDAAVTRGWSGLDRADDLIPGHPLTHASTLLSRRP